MKGFVIAGTQSGVGKTTFSLGLMAAFRRRGLNVQPFKVGPDFIDPSHHRAVCWKVSRNLDGWMLSKERNQEIFYRSGSEADLSIVEGVMGLFDGHGEKGETGSTAQMAKWLDLPVLLVIDARGMARSAAAMVLGYQTFDPALRLAGVLLNRVGSGRHVALLTEAIVSATGLPILGSLPRDSSLSIPERHLGLVPAGEIDREPNWADLLADRIEAGVDLDAVLRLAESAEPDIQPLTKGRGVRSSPSRPDRGRGPKVRLAVADDEAFSFYYPENLEALEAAGAELVFFSPLKDQSLPLDLCGIYLGGGYPEVHAARLEKNKSIRDEIKKSIQSGIPAYAECGGLIYLTKAIETIDGKAFEMVGVLPDRARMLSKRSALGYTEVRVSGDGTPLGPSGTVLRGHEFHYSELVAGLPGLERVYAITPKRGGTPQKEGYVLHRLLASYVHLRFDSAPGVADRFVEFLRSHCPVHSKHAIILP